MKPSKFPLCSEDLARDKWETLEDDPPCAVARKRLYADFLPYIKKIHAVIESMDKERKKDIKRIGDLEIAVKALKRKKGRKRKAKT